MQGRLADHDQPTHPDEPPQGAAGQPGHELGGAAHREDPAEAIRWLENRGFTVYLADTDESVNYRQVDYSGRTAFVVGSERYGISKPWYEHGFNCVGVPMLGEADSLNVSVSASVLLYEARARKAGW